MTKPQRIQRKRSKGWRMPEGAVYVGRPSRWGNPYAIGREGNAGAPRWDSWIVVDTNAEYHPRVAAFDTETEARADAVNRFAMWLLAAPRLWIAQTELAGRDLACWCPLEDEHGNRVPCHADVLLEIANSEVAP
ncbi:DUF4326 domain-containing protein [Mycolicibacterium sp.]|uniref:DUF4326 domain-containing protein n=1 Tax=Mycolicibacterium sp. TaxID=2320850 RepID=UPI00355EEE4B